MRIHHISCGTSCPRGARLLGGSGGLFERGRLVCHCLLIEAGDGLVLVDTGYGTDDARNPRQLGAMAAVITAPRPRLDETALAQVDALGFEAGDVRHIIVTHLDPDHSGGLPDFPDAAVHVFEPELRAALHPGLRDRPRYLAAHWRHDPKWVEHTVEGDEWHGFESARILPGLDPEVLLVPLPGHTTGHTGVAINEREGWLLHCGDAYFHHDQLAPQPSCPPLLRLFQSVTAVDQRARKANGERLRELASRDRDEVRLVCSHDPHDLEREQAGADDSATAG
jgi:glyoxylase-like metal-dependent hydrolase (beta-lactamase superfamily II)